MTTISEKTAKSVAVTAQQLIEKIDWDKVDGLIPAIIQDAHSAEVLMLGYMNAEALTKTVNDKKVCFYSRTKQRLWTKGESSKNYLNLVDLTLDCDNDSLLISVNPIGETCHLGNKSCFNDLANKPNLSFLAQLERIVQQRKNDSSDKSYTAQLYQRGIKRIAQKVGEEGVETALAAMAKDKEEIRMESADLLYHLIVLLSASDMSLADSIEILKQRNK